MALKPGKGEPPDLQTQLEELLDLVWRLEADDRKWHSRYSPLPTHHCDLPAGPASTVSNADTGFEPWVSYRCPECGLEWMRATDSGWKLRLLD